MDINLRNEIIHNWSNIRPKDLHKRFQRFFDGNYAKSYITESTNKFQAALELISKVLYFGSTFRKSDLIQCIKPGTIFYRARCLNYSSVNHSSKNVLNKVKNEWKEWDMWEPPIGSSRIGRFNMKGEPFLYLSRNKDVTLDEVRAKLNQYVVISKFVVNRPIKVDCIGFHVIENWLKKAVNDNKISKIGKIYDNFLTKAFTEKVSNNNEHWKYYISSALAHEYYNALDDPEKINAWKYPSMQVNDRRNNIYNICVKPEWAHRDLEIVNTQLGITKSGCYNHLQFQSLYNINFQNVPDKFNTSKTLYSNYTAQGINHLFVSRIINEIMIIKELEKYIKRYKFYLKCNKLSSSEKKIYERDIKGISTLVKIIQQKLLSIKNDYISLSNNPKKVNSYISQIVSRVNTISKLIIINEWAYDYMINSHGEVFLTKNGNRISKHIDKDGYYRVNLGYGNNTKSYRIDRLIVNMFIGPQTANHRIIHLNNIKTDNNLSNLEVI